MPKTWITRKGVHVDRIASAWLIHRFIEPDAVFRFVGDGSPPHGPGEIRFDMFEGEFTHRDNLCTFEVLLADNGLAGGALQSIGEIIHDLDLKDRRFKRPETAGFASLLAAIVNMHAD